MGLFAVEIVLSVLSDVLPGKIRNGRFTARAKAAVFIRGAVLTGIVLSNIPETGNFLMNARPFKNLLLAVTVKVDTSVALNATRTDKEFHGYQSKKDKLAR